DNKITTEWKAAPKVCYFCDQEGHIKKEYSHKIAQEIESLPKTKEKEEPKEEAISIEI
ncbi:16089_t:CDS:2, partial [Racocetra persica]